VPVYDHSTDFWCRWVFDNGQVGVLQGVLMNSHLTLQSVGYAYIKVDVLSELVATTMADT
jgi:hypothetical protein